MTRRWKIVLGIAVLGAIGIALRLSADRRGPKAVAATRQALRQQGFKTDLADFNFSTAADLRAGEAVLTAAVSNWRSEPLVTHPELMDLAGNNSAIVVWKQVALKKQFPSWPDNGNELAWDDFREAINTNRSQMDAACAAILSGPIGFNLDASQGGAMLLPHLAMLKTLLQALGDRLMLDLHDGDPDGAWTNLLAATRLVTAWQTEPAEVSQLVRFGNTTLAYAATWQALQTNGWPDDRLARLQREWETVDFFKELPETAAFQRASAVAMVGQERHESFAAGMTLDDLLQHPQYALAGFLSHLRRSSYRHRGTYEQEKALLLFYRDRELELRRAVQATTWSAMRQLPGVTNRVPFPSRFPSRTTMMMNVRAVGLAFQRQGVGLPGRAAEAEARRRLIITAIALDRYRGKHGAYPPSLSVLTPEFLKNPPLDFMDGQPLRYRLTDEGHFILYSVGLDCVDNGGKALTHEQRARVMRANQDAGIFDAAPETDIVWPRPASAADVEARRQEEKRSQELQKRRYLNGISDREWTDSIARQSRVAKILAMKWSLNTEQPSFKGRSVGDLISNVKLSGTNQLSLGDLLTPKPIVTGMEPEDITFELPVSYDAVTNNGFLSLIVDAEQDNPALFDSGGRMQDCGRATNGNCLLVWHTIYDPPGCHVVQVHLSLDDKRKGSLYINGPPISVVTSNLCQFSLASAYFDPETGATLQARLPEANGNYTIDFNTTNGVRLKTFTGSTTNGIIQAHWDLVDDQGHRFTNNFFSSIFHIMLPASGLSQTLRGP